MSSCVPTSPPSASETAVPPANMILSQKENIISAGRGSDDGNRARHRRLRPGRIGDGQTADGDGRHVVATDLDTPANRKEASSAARRRRGEMGRPDGSRPGRAPCLRSGSRGDHPPRRDHPAADLSESRGSRAQSTSTRPQPLVHIAEAQPIGPALGPGVEQRGLRRTQPAPVHRTDSRR